MRREIFVAVMVGVSTVFSPLAAQSSVRGGGSAQVLDFGSGEGSSGFVLGEDPRPVASVRAAMVDGFNSEIVSDQDVADPGLVLGFTNAPGVGQVDALPFVRSPSIRVPAWMRSSRAPLAAQVIDPSLPSIGNCGARPYSVSGIIGSSSEERRRMYYPLMVEAACRHGLPVGLFDAMIMQESRYNPLARSHAGAYGLGQLMPGTARQMGVNRYDIRGNLDGAARYLSMQLAEFGHPHLALAAYNAGPGRVRKHRRVPNISETRNYVTKVLWNWRMVEATRR